MRSAGKRVRAIYDWLCFTSDWMEILSQSSSFVMQNRHSRDNRSLEDKQLSHANGANYQIIFDYLTVTNHSIIKLESEPWFNGTFSLV